MLKGRLHDDLCLAVITEGFSNPWLQEEDHLAQLCGWGSGWVLGAGELLEPPLRISPVLLVYLVRLPHTWLLRRLLLICISLAANEVEHLPNKILKHLFLSSPSHPILSQLERRLKEKKEWCKGSKGQIFRDVRDWKPPLVYSVSELKPLPGSLLHLQWNVGFSVGPHDLKRFCLISAPIPGSPSPGSLYGNDLCHWPLTIPTTPNFLFPQGSAYAVPSSGMLFPFSLDG